MPNGPAKPGHNYTTVVVTNDMSKVSVTINGGDPVEIVSSTDLNNGTFSVVLSGGDIKCPGPIKVMVSGVLQETIEVDCP